MFARVGDKARRLVDALDRDRGGGGEDGLAERAGAAADVEPAAARRQRQPCQELARHQAAPATNIRLIGSTISPHALTLSHPGPLSAALRRGFWLPLAKNADLSWDATCV